MAWYENYDLSEDPFAANVQMYNVDKLADELAYRVESGSLVYVEGPAGSGKSAVLQKLIRQFGGHGKVIYFDCGQIERKVNIEKLMTGKYGLMGRLTGIKPKNMILLLDNANKLSRKNCERIKFYFDNNFVKAVVFTGLSYARAHFSDSLRDRIGGRVLKLPSLTPADAVKLVRQRFSDEKLFSEDLIKKIYKQSAGNVRKFLNNLGALAQKAYDSGSDQVTEEHVAEFFGGMDVK